MKTQIEPGTLVEVATLVEGKVERYLATFVRHPVDVGDTFKVTLWDGRFRYINPSSPHFISITEVPTSSGTETGRVQCAEPNITERPREIYLEDHALSASCFT